MAGSTLPRPPAKRARLSSPSLPYAHGSSRLDGGGGGGGEAEDSLRAETTEQEEEDDVELESEMPALFRVEDLDDRFKEILAGISSQSPRAGLIEFRKLLQNDKDGNYLYQYVLLSPKCAELMSVWALGPGAEPSVPLLELMEVMMKHPSGKLDNSLDSSNPENIRTHSVVVRARLDRLARSIVTTKLKDIYAHLSSSERSRQRSALLLVASIVRRGSSLASEIATNFDFTLNALPKLSKPNHTTYKSSEETKTASMGRLVRSAFIEFAMSFLEVCHAALLRWVLQIRPLYTGVLHKLSSDEDDTILSVLNVLREKVLHSSSMVPPGLQSAIFGDAALEQLAIISSNDEMHSKAAQAANDTLVLLCTDASHGICPDPTGTLEPPTRKSGSFGGGQGRLVRLMLKLRATESQNHRELLLSIAAGKPVLIAAYFDSFPYSLEPRASNAWFGAVSLVSDLIMLSKVQPPFTALATQGLPPPCIEDSSFQAILGSALPRGLTRLVINRGLLHSNLLIKHGCLRMLLEVISAVEFYMISIRKASASFQQNLSSKESRETGPSLMDRSLDAYDGTYRHSFESQKWLQLENNLRNELRSFTPDPQVLLSMFFSKPVLATASNKKEIRSSNTISMGEHQFEENALQVDSPIQDGHIEDETAKLVDLWNADSDLRKTGDLEDVAGFLNAKILDVLASYQRTIPMTLVECSFDVFKLLPEDPLSMTVSQQKSLLMLLLAASEEIDGTNFGFMPQGSCGTLTPKHLYRHLKSLLKFMLKSKVKCIKEQIQTLAYRAMISCGAFENNKGEIGIWLQFLPLFDDAVVSFFCDAVDTMGRDIDKYADILRSALYSASKLDGMNDPKFGPFGICVLDKCLRVLVSNTKSFNVPQKTSISIYVANALYLLLQSQARSRILGIVLNELLCSEKYEALDNTSKFRSEWSPLQNFQLEVRRVLREENLSIWDSNACHQAVENGTFTGCIQKAYECCKTDDTYSSEAKACALTACLLCIYPEELIENFPLLMEMFFPLFKGKLFVLAGIFGAYKWLLSAIIQSWNDLFNKAIKLASSLTFSRNIARDKKDKTQIEGCSLSDDPEEDNTFTSSSDITTLSFSVFLLSLPFGIIFPAALSARKPELFKVKEFSVLLESALSEVPPRLWLSTANSILFWGYEFQKSHHEGSDMEYQIEVCSSLLRYLIVPLERQGWLCCLFKYAEDPSIDVNLIIEFIGGVLQHIVMGLQSQMNEDRHPLILCRPGKREPADEFDGIESWLFRGRDALPFFDCRIFDILKELLQWSSNVSHKAFPAEVRRTVQVLRDVISMACKPFLLDALRTLKEAIDKKKTSAPEVFSRVSAYVVLHFYSYIDIELIVELSYTLLSRETCNGKVNDESSMTSLASFYDMGVHFATKVFNKITQLIQNKDSDPNGSICSSLLQSIYKKILELIRERPSESIYSCLLSALEANYGQHFITSDGFLYRSYSSYFSVCIHKMPTEVLHHLMTNIDRTKARIVFYLVQVSHIFLAEVFEALCQHLGLPNIQQGPVESPRSVRATDIYTQKEMILMLPVVNWLICAIGNEKNNSLFSLVEQVTVSYYRMIMEITKQCDMSLTELDVLDVLPFANSQEGNNNVPNLFGLSTPGQLMLMLKHCLAYHSFSMKEKKKLFISILHDTNLLSIKDVNTWSVEDTVKSVNNFVGKIMMAKMLFMHDTIETCNSDAVTTDNKDSMDIDGMAGEVGGGFHELADILIQTLKVIFKYKSGDNDEHRVFEIFGRKFELFKRDIMCTLERTLLNELKEIFMGPVVLKDETQILSLLKKFTKIVLQFRFCETLPMQVLRCCVSTRWENVSFSGRYSAYGLKLLVGHSEFAETLLFSKDISRSHSLTRYFHEKDAGTRSLPSILYLLKQHLFQNLTVPEPQTSHCLEIQSRNAEGKKLELLKFLRLLYFLKRQTLEKEVLVDTSFSSIEMLSLLLASYSASLSDVDKENLLLMQEIESFEGLGFPGILGMDYLWGQAALKRWREKSRANVYEVTKDDSVKELWKRSFREDLMLDSTRCALCVLFFPSQRKLCAGTFVLPGIKNEEDQLSTEGGDERMLRDAAYDPCFILPFALHCLSSGWMMPDDFARKGLLAATLVSISSADEDMRKLGYEILAKYLTILEGCESFKGKLQIKLLLMFLKNMVVEPWQRFPFITTLFVAEASCMLMHPSDVHYPAISKLLLHTPGIDVETIPLFKPLFGSGSVHFRADRAWMLRLLAFGLRTSFDSLVYRRRFVLEIMMSFYKSPLADKHTREWIFQILRRASKLRSLVQYLVENTGLLSWLSSILCSDSTAKSGEYAFGISDDFALEALQVLENALSWRSVKRWLVLEGFEELLKTVWILHRALVKNPSFSRTTVFLKPYLRILRTAFRLSLARRKYQSHLKFSVADFFVIVQLIKAQENVNLEIQTLALETIVESSPPACISLEDKLNLFEIGTWAYSRVQFEHLISRFSFWNVSIREKKDMDNFEKKEVHVDGLLYKVLRWIVSSLILGGLELGIVSRSCPTAWECLQSTMSTVDPTSTTNTDGNTNLLRLLINLHYLSGYRMSVASSSIVCACILLLPQVSEPCGIVVTEYKSLLEELLSHVSAPPEINISWRWNKQPSVSLMPLKDFETKTCALLVFLFLQLVNVERKTDIPCMVKRLQLAFENLLRSQQQSA